MIESYPFPHIVIDNFLDIAHGDLLVQDFYDHDHSIWSTEGKKFENEHGCKQELTKYDFFPSSIKRLVQVISSDKFVNNLKTIFEIDDLFIDKTFFGGGMNIAQNDSYLHSHLDFNFNNDIKAYRCLNLLYYVNKDWLIDYGGCLEFYDNSTVVKTIEPFFNRCAIFSLSDRSFHGYNTIKHPKNTCRKSFGAYYYTQYPIKGTSQKPHKTLWS